MESEETKGTERGQGARKSRFRRWVGAPLEGLVALWRVLTKDRRRRTWGLPVFALLALALLWVVSAPFVMSWHHDFPELSVRTQRTPVAESDAVEGVAYVDAILRVHDRAMTPWLPNDRLVPTILLDNPQNFQRGVLEAERYAVRVLRDNLSRQRTTDAIDADIEIAFNNMAISADAWILPRAEDRYGIAMDALRRYRARLVTGEAHFYPRADNLVELMVQFNSLTGGANTRLYNCVGDLPLRLSEETADDPLLKGESIVRSEVPWSEVDDHFYHARGVAYVYREILISVTVDFRRVMELRNAGELADSIIYDFLDYAQFDPIYVANGSYGSLWANHPYQLLGLLSQARERSRSLITMLSVNVH